MADELSLPQDYVDFLRALTHANAEFLLIGGWAVAVHGYARATDDLDILVRPTPENAAAVFEGLQAFGAPLASHHVTEDLFARPRYGYRMGRRPLLIEILTTIDGVDFDQASTDPIRIMVEDIEVQVIGRDALLLNKRAAGRPKDLADIEGLSGEDGA